MNQPAPSPFDAFKPMAGRALEIALNRVIALDPETRAALDSLDGRRIEIALESPALALSIAVRDRKLWVGPPETGSEPDLGLRATLGGLLSQLPFTRRDGAPPVGKLRINGDAELARTLQKLAQGFDPDWERPFADALGPILGPQAARMLREGLRNGRRVAGNFARDAAEFVTEESRDVVGKDELAAFHDDVDALRDRAERLNARVDRLRQRGDAA
ncbi:SCP2 domain-containing protein [Arenimonas sp.]|uniref:ubiquinone biosynthesis accessory factor UbiJ n=1 Tax=Arenimonas sp. TaxID=1872635 RepID=UPI0039E3A969